MLCRDGDRACVDMLSEPGAPSLPRADGARARRGDGVSCLGQHSRHHEACGGTIPTSW
jgi:hypothetical protein